VVAKKPSSPWRRGGDANLSPVFPGFHWLFLLRVCGAWDERSSRAAFDYNAHVIESILKYVAPELGWL
jgi:hypothetical protein